MTIPDEDDTKNAGLYSMFSIQHADIHVNPTPKPPTPAPTPPTPTPNTDSSALYGKMYLGALTADPGTFLGFTPSSGIGENTPQSNYFANVVINFISYKDTANQCFSTFWNALTSANDWGTQSVLAGINKTTCTGQIPSPPTIAGGTVSTQPNLGQLLLYGLAVRPDLFFPIEGVSNFRAVENYFPAVISTINACSNPTNLYNAFWSKLSGKSSYTCAEVVAACQAVQTEYNISVTPAPNISSC